MTEKEIDDAAEEQRGDHHDRAVTQQRGALAFPCRSLANRDRRRCCRCCGNVIFGGRRGARGLRILVSHRRIHGAASVEPRSVSFSLTYWVTKLASASKSVVFRMTLVSGPASIAA